MCAFLLLRFASASASSLCRFLSCALDYLPHTHAFSGFSLLHDRRLPAKLRGEKNSSPKDPKETQPILSKNPQNSLFTPLPPLPTSFAFFCCPLRTCCSLLAAHSSAAHTAAFSSVKKRLLGGALLSPCRSKPVGTDSAHVAHEREHVRVYYIM
eukprot:COSAG06_NODE_9683_length_1845_cov_2.204467_1_plen_154_part_00